MTPDVLVATPQTPLKRAAALMRGNNIGCLPIVDGKHLVGIITTSDLLDLIATGSVVRRKPTPRAGPSAS